MGLYKKINKKGYETNKELDYFETLSSTEAFTEIHRADRAFLCGSLGFTPWISVIESNSISLKISWTSLASCGLYEKIN